MKNNTYSKNSKLKYGLIMVAVLAVVLIVVAAIVLPSRAPDLRESAPTIETIVIDNEGQIGIGADISRITVTIRYSNGTEESRRLSELTVVGLDTSKEATLDNVVISFGNYTKTVTFTVLPVSYEVKYISHLGGYIEGATTQTVPGGTTATTVRAIPDEGYVFDQWSDGYTKAERTDQRVSKNEEFYAVFKPKEYVVLFTFPDGTSAREEIVQHGKKVLLRPREDQQEMLKYGYVFTGWSATEEELNYVTKDMIIVPNYDPYYTDFSLDITKDIENQPLGTSDVKSYYTKEETAIVTVKANPDRVFVGWQIMNFLGDWVDIMPTAPDQTIPITNGGDYVKFSTQYSAATESYSLSFVPNGGATNTSGTVEIKARAIFAFTKSVLTFVSNTETIFSTEIEKDMTIGACFEVLGNQNADFNSVNVGVVNGYTFMGWYIKNGGVDNNGKPLIVKNSQTFEQSATLIALWERNVYTIMFEPGEREDTTETHTVEVRFQDSLAGRYQDSQTGEWKNIFPDDEPKKTNYTFIGWFLVDENGVLTDRIVDKTYKVERDNTIIKPKFEVNKENLTVTLEGVGTIVIKAENESTFAPINGIYKLDIEKSYTIRLTAATDYYLVEYTVETKNGIETFLSGQGSGTAAVTNTTYEITGSAANIITSFYKLHAVFRKQQHDIAVYNGISTNSGTLTYEAVVGQGLERFTTSNSYIEFKCNDGMSLHIIIAARDGYYISSIKVNNVPIGENTAYNKIPDKATLYTLVIEDIKIDKTDIRIEYGEMLYEVEVKNPTAPEGTIVAISPPADGKYTHSDTPKFIVTAASGYYISALLINDVRVDPYQISNQFNISNLRVMGITPPSNASGEGGVTIVGDERITSYEIEILGMTAGFRIQAVYEEVYYLVTARADGSGEVSPSVTRVTHNQSISILAVTYTGYYVASYTINNQPGKPFEGFGTVQAIDIEGIKSDLDIVVTFYTSNHIINFTANNANIEYREDNIDKSESISNTIKTFMLNAGTNGSYTVRAEYGYEITEVLINNQRQDIPFNSTHYTFKIDNIMSDYNIEIICTAKMFTVDYFLLNGNDAIVYEEADVISLGGTYRISITLPAGKSINIDNITIKSVLSPNKPVADMTKSLEIEGNTFKLSFTNVNESIEIFIPIGYNNIVEGGSEHQVGIAFNDLSLGVLATVQAVTGILTDLGNDLYRVTTGSNLSVKIILDTSLYMIKYITINGTQHAASDTISLNEINKDTYIEVIIDTKLYNLAVQQEGSGMVASSTSQFRYMQGDKVGEEKVMLSITPGVGYEITQFKITDKNGNGISRHKDDLDSINAGNPIYIILPAELQSDITVFVTFTPKEYDVLVVTKNHGIVENHIVGSAVKYSYSTRISLKIKADESNFIYSINVNENSVNPATLLSAAQNSLSKYVSGELIVEITENTTIEIVFSPNVYNVSVSSSMNGKTTVGTEDGTKTSTTGISVYSSDVLIITMSSHKGYHIVSLEIGGVMIDDWQKDSRPENNRLISYRYGESGYASNITKNLTIRVVYEINEYKVTYSISNKSDIFAVYETSPSQYGDFSIYGHTPDVLNSIYEGIKHGEDLRFIFAPIVTKGYYVSLFTIEWTDSDNQSSNQKEYEDRTLEAASGQYIFNIRSDMRIVIEFKRQVFTYFANRDVYQNDSPFVSDGSLTTVFQNPYSGAIVESFNNQYEYGVMYTVYLNPGTGYHLDSLMISVNGGESVNSIGMVRSNQYQSEIRSNVSLLARYVINMYDVYFTSSSGGDIKIINGAETLLEKNTVRQGSMMLQDGSGKVEFYEDCIRVTHGSVIYFVISPHYDSGYRITSFRINSTQQGIGDPNVEQIIQHTVTSEIKQQDPNVVFNLRQYTITITSNMNGGTVTPSSVTLDWGKSYSDFRTNVFTGYSIIQVTRDGADDFEIFDKIKNLQSATFSVNVVKSNIVIHIVYIRNPINVEFSGGYNEEFMVGTEKQASITGMIVNPDSQNPIKYFSSANSLEITQNSFGIPSNGIVTGGENAVRYGDTILIYIIPINGYYVKTITIAREGAQNQIINSPSQLGEINENGYYVVRVDNITTKISIYVDYAVKEYTISQKVNGSGKVDYIKTNEVTDIVITKVNHHEVLTIQYTAFSGFNLKSLVINGKTFNMNHETKQEIYNNNGADANRNYYVYTLTITVDDYLMDGLPQINIEATFQANSYNVKIYVNGIDINAEKPDTTLKPTMNSYSVTFGVESKVTQIPEEGYSIVEAYLKNASGNIIIGGSTYSEMIILVDSLFVTMLDYHSAVNNVLIIEYTTAKDKYASTIGFNVHEDATENNTTIPKYDGKNDVFVITAQYNGEAPDGGEYYYDTVRIFDINIASDASRLYIFAGYQEETSPGVWSYVENGKNGIVLLNNGTRLQYNVQSERNFRAVVYRLYEVEVEVHPEFKYYSGSYSTENSSMRYTLYSRVTATVQFTQDANPNAGQLVFNLTPETSYNNATYNFLVYSGAKLTLLTEDTVQGQNQNPSSTFDYYFISYPNNVLTQTPAALRTGETIGGNKTVHVYARNSLFISPTIETEGETSVHGGTVQYYDETNARSLTINQSTSSIATTANTRIRITITPKDNYRFDKVLFRQFSSIPDANNYRVITNNWLNLKQDNGEINVEPNGSFDGSINMTTSQDGKSIIITMRVVENMVLKFRFWKQITFKASIRMFDDSINSNIVDAFTPTYTSGVRELSEVKDYNSSLQLSIKKPTTNSSWYDRYQFVGFEINGVLNNRQLERSYPTPDENGYYTNTFMLNNEMVSIVNAKDGTFLVDVVAVFIPIINVTIENEYRHQVTSGDFAGEDVYFNLGQITYGVVSYNQSRIDYNFVTRSSSTYLGGTNYTDKSFQALTKINTKDDGDRSSTSSPYNTWENSYLALSWVGDYAGTIKNSYKFIEWRYYDPDKGWLKLPYFDEDNTNNKANSQNYVFPLTTLINLSYFMDLGRKENESKYQNDISMYELSGAFKERMENVPTIRIRPFMTREETIYLDKALYTTSINDAPTTDPTDPLLLASNSARIVGSTLGDEKRDEYGKILTLNPAPETGYEFLGWYEMVETPGGYEEQKITYAGTWDKNVSRRLVKAKETDSEPTLLEVRVVSTKTYYAKYIRLWSVYLSVQSTSGNSAEINNSLPKIEFYGTDQNTDKKDLIYFQYNRYDLRAGTIIYFKLQDNANFKDGVDMYHPEGPLMISDRGVSWVDSADSTASYEPRTNSNITDWRESLFVITADDNKVITIRFQTVAKMTITNFFKGGTLVLPEALGTALEGNGVENSMIKDGGIGDDDGIENGEIVISKIPVFAGLNYGKGYGVKLTDNLNPIMSTSNWSTAVFNGNDQSFKKEFTLPFFDSSGGSGASGLAAPFAVDSETKNSGNGTESNPFRISDVSHFKTINKIYEVNGNDKTSGLYYALVASVNLNALEDPICSDTNSFNGILDGKGNTISNITVNKPNLDYVGLFAKMNGGTVKNVKIGGANVSVSGRSFVGLIAGYIENSTIENVDTSDANSKSITGNIESGRHIGGLVGEIKDNSIVTGCDLSGIKVSGYENVGGLVGTISDTSALKDSIIRNPIITTKFRNGGGAVGIANGNAGIVDAMDGVTVISPQLQSCQDAYYIGGIIGSNGHYVSSSDRSSRTISNLRLQGDSTINSKSVSNFGSFSANHLSGYGSGGIAGFNEQGSIMRYVAFGNAKVDDSTSLTGDGAQGRLTMDGTYIGGVVGINQGTIDRVNFGNHRIYANRKLTGETYTSGLYAVIAAYNSGSITNARVDQSGYNDEIAGSATSNDYTLNVSTMNNMSGFSTDKNFTIADAKSDTTTLYVGGIAAYNSGVIRDSFFKGKLMVERIFRNEKGNTSHIGGIVGQNTGSSGNVSYNSAKDAFIALYVAIWTDKTSSESIQNPPIQYFNIGMIAGSGSVGGQGDVSGNTIRRHYHACGSHRIDAASGVFTSHRNASEFGIAKISDNCNGSGLRSGGNIRTESTNKSIPTELNNGYNTTLWVTRSYYYNEKLRQVQYQ